jgi:signal transduction histidine kinase/CheY-like chemotaxis protein
VAVALDLCPTEGDPYKGSNRFSCPRAKSESQPNRAVMSERGGRLCAVLELAMEQPKDPIATLEHVTRLGTAAQVTVLEGCARGARFRVSESATIGRSPDATIMLDDAEISRLHARISRTDPGAFLLEDLGSRNGTFVNGTRVNRRLLALGDKIRVGPQTVLELQGFDPTEDYIIQRQRFESLGRLSVGIAHDLNNVLATLDAGTSYLQKLPVSKVLADPDVRECIADLSLAANRASELTRSIVSFARGRGTERSCIDLSKLIGEVVRMLRHAFEHNIRIEPITVPNVLVYGSKSELHQVLLNLCLNARDAMPDGGVLRITTSILTAAPPELGWQSNQSVAVLSVSDTGIGMDMETQSRLFELFYTTKREGAGYGLGLANVREIVTLHGGQISLQSAIGEGTCFTIHMPLLNADQARMSATGEEPSPTLIAPPQSSVTVLLVDDEPVVRRSVARRLRLAGLQVTEASDGLEAIEQYGRLRHTLVVLDFDMPRLDGPDTQARLLAMDPNVRIVFATGYADPERATAVRVRGALALLEKPYNLDTLIRLAKDESAAG